MNPQNLPVKEGKNKNWPDFYSILDSSPEIDTETLRRSINALYLKANQDSDHRELSIRFYNQVLTEKVLPQCRRILLNDFSRQAYDEQWYLHREGAEHALSYQEFVHSISKDVGTERALLLSSDEISILPSFSAPDADPNIGQSFLEAVAVPISEPASKSGPASSGVSVSAAGVDHDAAEPQEVLEGEEVIESPLEPASFYSNSNVSNSAMLVSPNAQPQLEKKKFPLVPALVAAALVIAVGGFFMHSSSQSDDSDTAATFEAARALARARQKAAAQPTPVSEFDHPLIRLNTLARNADFENGRIDPWIPSNKQVYVEHAPLHNAKSGNGIMTFWDTVPYDANVHQIITGLTPGKYTLQAWTQRTGGQERAEMSVTGYGGPTRIITLPAEPTWTLAVIRDIDVKIDRCEIGFSAKAPAYKHVQVDCVEFFKQ